MKLIKINTDHYIIVDDSEIKEGDYVSTNGGGIRYVTKLNNYKKDNTFLDDGLLSNQESSPSCHIYNYKKITHSTHPMQGVFPIPITEVKELIGEVDMAFKHYPIIENNKQHNDRNYYRRAAYYRALEDNKEKKYTEEQMRECWRASERFDRPYNEGYAPNLEEFIQSLQPKTEWEVEMVDGKLKLI